MEKLLDLVQKLRESIVPTAEIKSISKKELLSFIEDADILKKMSIFHEKKQSKALKSIVHEAEEESVVPDLTTIRKWPVSKLRKLLRSFHRDIGLGKGIKHSKMSVSKLRSFVSRNRYQEMLYGDDDMPFLGEDADEEIKKKSSKKKEPKEKERKEGKEIKSGSGSVVNVYTAPQTKSDKDCACEMPNILEEHDASGIIMSLAPELYRTLLSKSYILDLCNLNRMRREHEVCAVACDPKAYNRWACCERPCGYGYGIGGVGGYGRAGAPISGLGEGGFGAAGVTPFGLAVVEAYFQEV